MEFLILIANFFQHFQMNLKILNDVIAFSLDATSVFLFFCFTDNQPILHRIARLPLPTNPKCCPTSTLG